MKSKTKKLKILPGLQKWTKKTASALLSAGMALSVFTSPLTVMADGPTGSTTVTEGRNVDINPEFTIQHYLNFPAVEKFTTNKINNQSNNDPNKIPYGYIPVPIIDTHIDEEKAIYPKTGKAKLPKNGDTDQIKYVAFKDTDSQARDNNEVGELYTRTQLVQLFDDEKAEYLNKPQIQYMNRLYNSTTGTDAYNANYTLKEVKVILPSTNETITCEVPFLFKRNGTIDTISGKTNRHNPSRIRFTNNPETIEKIHKKQCH